METKRGVVTVRDWVWCADNNQYKAFFGNVKFEKAEDVLGYKPGSGQANFIVKVGLLNPIYISGCEFIAFHGCEELIGSKSTSIYWVE